MGAKSADKHWQRSMFGLPLPTPLELVDKFSQFRANPPTSARQCWPMLLKPGACDRPDETDTFVKTSVEGVRQYPHALTPSEVDWQIEAETEVVAARPPVVIRARCRSPARHHACARLCHDAHARRRGVGGRREVERKCASGRGVAMAAVTALEARKMLRGEAARLGRRILRNALTAEHLAPSASAGTPARRSASLSPRPGGTVVRCS